MLRTLSWSVLLVALGGCYLSHRIDESEPPDASVDVSSVDTRVADTARDLGRDTSVDEPADPPADVFPPPFICPDGRVAIPSELNLDLLFMVDDSDSMGEEQASLRRGFGQMLDILLTGDLDADGRADFPPVESMHVAVASTNQGSPGGEFCNVMLRPSGGIFVDPGDRACDDEERYLCHGRGDDPAQMRNDFGFLSNLGTRGCIIEQPLEAVLQSLSPEGVHEFVSGEGRINAQNSGFRREDAVLGVLMITDEDDCSVADPEFYREREAYPSVPLERRCESYPEALHPVRRYVEGFAGLSENDFVLAAIAGIPEDLEELPLEEILADPRMQNRDGSSPRALAPACTSRNGRALPGRRIARVIDGLGASGSLHSLCREDLTPALRTIASRLGEVMFRRACE